MDDDTIIVLLFVGVVFVLFVLFRSSSSSSQGTGAQQNGTGGHKFTAIPDNFTTLEQVQEALRKAGLESCNLIMGIDFTLSNETSGRRTFGGQSLHKLSTNVLNPYQRVLSVLGRTLEPFDEDKLIPVYGFGDLTTKGTKVFPFYPDRPCQGFEDAMRRYAEVVPLVQLSGPTNFAPLIREAISIVREEKDYHILVIVADGQVTSERETVQAIVEASNYPLSIIVVGVGDGPWDQMEAMDDGLPQRQFDNFQFVNFAAVTEHARNPDESFAMNALMEIPEQYSTIKRLGLL